LAESNEIQVARVLAEEATACETAGEIVRPYLLYTEAAKRDPGNVKYRNGRDKLAAVAGLLMRSKLERPTNISRDIKIAELQSAQGPPPTKPAQDEKQRGEGSAAERVESAAPSLAAGSRPEAQAESGGTAEAATPEAVPVPAASESPEAAAVTVSPVEPSSVSPAPVRSKGDDTNPVQQPTLKTGESGGGDPWRFTFGTQILGYGTYNSIRGNSVFNPDNELAAFATEDFHVAVRPDLKLSNSIFSFSAKPRMDYDHSLNASSHDADYYLQEWSARVQATSALTLSYGREVLMWGPSMSLPASNPWFRDNGRNTPLLEIGARDFARAIWQPSSQFAISYIANTALRRGTPDFLPFRPTGAVKVDYIGQSVLLSGIYSNALSSPFGQRKFIGGYFQKTLGQSIRFYVEGSAQQGNPGYFPDDSVVLGAGYAQTKLYEALAPRTIIGGFAYTDTRAGTWTAEYIYNPAGYDSMMADSFYSIAQGLSQAYLQGGSSAALAAEELARASNPGVGPLRRHYAFWQYQRNGLDGRFDVVLRYTLDAQDLSGQAVAYVTWNTSNHFQVLAVLAGMNGSVDTEYARYLHYQAQLGFRFFLH
jgi:hypothetical protein